MAGSGPLIRTLIVDDAPLVREAIRVLLEGEPDIEIVGEACDGPAAVEAITSLKPDLTFLDVQMPGFDGFEVLERTAHVHLSALVFVTAYDHYAARAFEVNAVGYLVKPITRSRFREVLERTRHLLAHEKDAEHTQQRLAELISQHVLRPESDEEGVPRRRRSSRLVVKDNNRFVMLRTAEIDWISSAGDYVKLYSRGRTFLIRLTMSEIEEKLEPERFARIHRSTIVNLDRVDEIRPLVHGDFDVLLKDGTTLRLSRSYRERLLSEVIR